MPARSEPLLWVQLIGAGVFPLEGLLLLLLLAGSDPGPVPALERLLCWALGGLAPTLLLWHRPADVWSLLLLQTPLRARRPLQQRLSRLQDNLGLRLGLALAGALSLPLLWWLDEHAAVATALSPVAGSPRLVALLLAAVVLALMLWQWQQLLQALWLLSRSPEAVAAAKPMPQAELEEQRLCLGLPLLLLDPLQVSALPAASSGSAATLSQPAQATAAASPSTPPAVAPAEATAAAEPRAAAAADSPPGEPSPSFPLAPTAGAAIEPAVVAELSEALSDQAVTASVEASAPVTGPDPAGAVALPERLTASEASGIAVAPGEPEVPEAAEPEATASLHATSGALPDDEAAAQPPVAALAAPAASDSGSAESLATQQQPPASDAAPPAGIPPGPTDAATGEPAQDSTAASEQPVASPVAQGLAREPMDPEAMPGEPTAPEAWSPEASLLELGAADPAASAAVLPDGCMADADGTETVDAEVTSADAAIPEAAPAASMAETAPAAAPDPASQSSSAAETP